MAVVTNARCHRTSVAMLFKHPVYRWHRHQHAAGMGAHGCTVILLLCSLRVSMFARRFAYMQASDKLARRPLCASCKASACPGCMSFHDSACGIVSGALAWRQFCIPKDLTSVTLPISPSSLLAHDCDRCDRPPSRGESACCVEVPWVLGTNLCVQAEQIMHVTFKTR